MTDCMHSRRVSVPAQYQPQPFILSMSRQNSASAKRDSAISGVGGGGGSGGSGGGTGGPPIAHRTSSLREHAGHRLSTSTAASDSGMAPVYRLYPHQSSIGRRELRAMEKENANINERRQSRERSKVSSIDTAIYAPAANTELKQEFPDPYMSRRSQSGSNFIGMNDESGQSIVAADFSPPGGHIPSRTSSSGGRARHQSQQISQPKVLERPRSPVQSTPGQVSSSPSPIDDNEYEPGARSSAGSLFSQETAATSIHTLPPLQTKGPDNAEGQHLEPVLEDDPRSWDLLAPVQEQDVGMYALEKRADQLFSAEHLRAIFEDPKLLLRFTGFLNAHRPQSIPVLIYYLDALKALRAINYANAIAEALEPIKDLAFTNGAAKPTINAMLEEKADHAFEVLVQEDLPAYITHTWIQVVGISIKRRVTGTLAPHLREASEGLAEVFCLTDPSRTDNPIVFASEEFTRTTQYGMGYVIGRNCRFLQGPRTSPHSVRRLAIATSSGKEHVEVFVNYRRDGSPFMNLLMTAPLMDSRGNIRYFIGAQVDVSGLIKDCSEMDGLVKLVEKEQRRESGGGNNDEGQHKDEFQELSEMFNGAELDTVQKSGGRMHKEYVDDSDRDSIHGGRPRLLLKDHTQEMLRTEKAPSETGMSTTPERFNGKLEGVYQHYLLIRPAPSLRILFTSPSLRVPGILQSPFLNRIGGSSRVRSDLRSALAEGRGVTAKIRWLTRPHEDGDGEGRPRWIHCTPLLGHTGTVGVWMIVLVDEEGPTSSVSTGRRFRQAPPVSTNIGGKEWDTSQSMDRKQLNTYDKQEERRGGGGSKVEYFHRPGNNVPAPSNRTRDQSLDQQHVSSASASEFSFNLKG